MRKVFLSLLLALAISTIARAQQPQTPDVSSVPPIFAVNAEWVNGIAPGYWPTAGSGLTLNISAGTVFCSGSIVTYAGSTLTMTNNTTNYVYLDTTSSCAPASNTSGFSATTIPVAKVVTSGGNITAITDDRVSFSTATGAALGTVTSVATTSPITGGTITATGTIACATCATTVSGGSLSAVSPMHITNGGAISLQNSTPADVTGAYGTDTHYFTASGGAATNGNVIEGDSAGGIKDSGTALSSLLTTAVTSVATNNGLTGGTITTTGTLGMTTAQRTRTCVIMVGADNGSALVNADLGPQGRQCFIPYASTVVEVTVAGDAGTPNVIPAKNHAGSLSDFVSSALATASSGGIACSNTGGTTGLDGATTCSATLQNTSLSAGDWIDLHSGTAGGTAKRMSISISYTVN